MGGVILSSNNLLKGNISFILLSALMEGDKYGYEITRQISSLTNDEINLKEGSLYPALHKLEKEGLASSYWQEQEPGKPSRKYYQITDKGKETVIEERKTWKSFMSTMERIIYGEQNS